MMLVGVSASLCMSGTIEWSYPYSHMGETFSPIHGGFQYSQSSDGDTFTVLSTVKNCHVALFVLKTTANGDLVNVGKTSVPWHRMIEWAVSTISRSISFEQHEQKAFEQAAFLLIEQEILEQGDFGTKAVEAYEAKYGRPFDEHRLIPELYEVVFYHNSLVKTCDDMLSSGYAWTALPDFSERQHMAVWCRGIEIEKFPQYQELEKLGDRVGGVFNVTRQICAYRAKILASKK